MAAVRGGQADATPRPWAALPAGSPGATRTHPVATAALHRAAASLGATLTDDDVAIGRASAAVARLDSMIEGMRRDGTLREFNARYQAGRAAALAEGRGFIGYGVAMARLKRALIPMLQSGKPMRGVFEEVFR